MLGISNKSSARALLNLPNDISRQVLNDVPLYRVLAMAASLDGTKDGQSFKGLLLSLSLQKTFFRDEEYLTYMINLYKFYREVLQSASRYTEKLSDPKESPLAMNLGLGSESFLDAPRWEDERAKQRDWLFYEIYLVLLSFNWIDIFPPVAEKPKTSYYGPARSQDPRLFDHYKEYCQTIKERHFRWANKRLAQIQMLVDIFREYPTYLKKTSDPGFEARSNHAHIIIQLESCAKKYRKDLLRKRYLRRECYLYQYDHLPLIPLDKYLHLFIHTLARYPYECSSSDPDNSSRPHLEAENLNIPGLLISSDNPSKSLVYPTYIRYEIDRVIEGLAYVYSTSNQVITRTPPHQERRRCLIKRTKFTVYPGTPQSEQLVLVPCEFCEDTCPGTMCYKCYQTLLRVLKRTRDPDKTSLSHGSPSLTATSLGFEHTLVVHPKPIFTVPPWRHLRSREGYGFVDIDQQALVKTLTHFNIPPRSISRMKFIEEADARGTKTLRDYLAGRITRRAGDPHEPDEWDEREFQWLESFLRVIKWMEAQGLRA